jgi:hypothetical protein
VTRADRRDLAGLSKFLKFNLHRVLAPHSQYRGAVTPAHRGRGAPKPPVSGAEAAKPSPQGSVVRVEGRDEILKRLGRSPDWASAYVLALMDTPHLRNVKKLGPAHRAKRAQGHEPFEYMRKHA